MTGIRAHSSARDNETRLRIFTVLRIYQKNRSVIIADPSKIRTYHSLVLVVPYVVKGASSAI